MVSTVTPIIEAQRVSKRFGRKSSWLGMGGESGKVAVRELSLLLYAGETVAIVGESGCGKSTTARMVMRLLQPDEGRILWQGEDVTHCSARRLRPLRRHVQMVFQDPFASLNPRMTIERSVSEGLRVHQPQLSRSERRQQTATMLEQCGLDAAIMERYPHQFSGGQRQRIGIARALIVRPKALVLDEPVSALDVSVQAQILNLLRALQQRYQLGYLFISHDLSVVRYVADRILVMFRGEVVEQGSVEEIFTDPQHEYTRALLAAKPALHPDQRIELQGESACGGVRSRA
ncbi:MAG: ATP-binding cassette domain-containing protein [Mariprofundales bacterium]|nr:ATP-binding cassette domain-containing protein [Mariprofundales bacterium]